MNDITIKNPLQSQVETAFGNKAESQTDSVSFGKMLTDSINKVNQHQLQADESIQNLVSGKQTDIAQTMIAMEKASVSFELIMQIRNKVISAYDKIMRMPV